MLTDTQKLLPLRAMVERYSVTERTIDRWLASGILPEPLRINGIRYWRLGELERRERERMGSQAPKSKTRKQFGSTQVEDTVT
jgi:predicted DNA-binding transcriptional regulator AlpA